MRMIKSLVLGAVSLLALASWAQAAELVGDLKQRYDTLQSFQPTSNNSSPTRKPGR